MKSFIKNHRNKVIIILHHILLMYGLTALHWSWESVIFAIIGAYISFGLFAHTAHLYFSHRKFTPHWYNIIYAFLVNSMNAIGGAFNFSVIHRHHHKYSDTPQDPHSPTQIGPLRVYLLLWKHVKINPVISRDIAKSKGLQFLHHHQVKLHLFTTAVIWLINPALVLLIISPSVVYTFHVNGLVNWLGHKNGVARNIPELAWLTPLSWRHGDHHKY